jgi:hypothetical protein
MRIAFVSPNRERLPDPVLPLGLLYLSGVAGDTHDKALIDLCFEPDPLDALSRRLRDFRPGLVAVSMRNIQNADYTGTATTLGWYDEVVRTIRANTDAPVAMGGGGFSILAPELAQRFGVDHAVAGEGEAAFARLLTGMAAEPAAGAHRGFLDLAANVRPDRTGVDPRYYELTGMTSIQTKRGCSLQCDYCTYPLIEGRAIRQRPAADVAAEWAQAVAAHPAICHVFIVDSVFNLPPHHALAVCEALVALGNTTPWTCYLNPIRFDGRLAAAMARAGCAGVEIGADSGTEAGLLRLRKGFTLDDIRGASRLCRDAGIKDFQSFIFGTPGETLDDVERSLDFLEELDPFAAFLMAWKDDHEAVDAALGARRADFRGQVLERIGRRAAGRPRWIVPSLGVGFSERLFDSLRRSGMRGPLWQHLGPQRPRSQH